VAASFVGILLLAAASFGQNPLPSGNLYGTVLDEQGASLSGVTARLSGPGAPQTTVSNAKGDFHFLNLSPGAYTVTLERAGFQTVRRDITVLLGKNAVLSVTLPVAGAAEAVTVSGQAPAVDSRKTETGANFGQKELHTIPTTRDYWALLRQVPGVLIGDTNVGGDAFLWQPGFVGKGSDSSQNTFNLDGVGITDIWGTTPVQVDFDAIDDIEVATGGSDPSLATPGVTLNLVTKRGTNQLVGSARTLYAGGTGWDYGVEAGGPLWKDRVWLWGAGGRKVFPGQTFVTPTGDPVQSKENIDHWNAKLNAQPAAANALVLSYVNTVALNKGEGAGPFRSQPSTWNADLESAAYRLEDSQVLSARLFASLYFSYLSMCCTETPQGGVDKQADTFDDVWQNSAPFYRTRRPQRQAGLTASGFFDMGDLRHELKFGFGYRSIQISSMSTWPGDQLVGSEYSDPNSAIPNNAAITRAQHLRSEGNYYNTYLGDTVQAGNLTVSVGARFDYQQARNLPSEVPANPVFPEVLPAVRYAGDSGYPITWRQLQPRIGATYSVGSNRNTLLRASYSRFANRLNSEIRSINAFPGPAYTWYYWNDTNENHHVEPGEVDFSRPPLDYWNVDPANPGSSVPVNRIATNLKPPTTDEFLVGAERQIVSDLSVSLAYTHRSVHHLEFAPVIGTSRGSYQYIANASGTATSADGFVLNFNEPYYALTDCPAPCAGTELENRPDSTQTYDGAEVQVIKQLSHGWMLRASFAYNDWQQDVGSRAIVDPNNLAGGSNASGPVVQPAGTRLGTVYINSKWQFNVSGMVQLPLAIVASANFFGRQGYPIVYHVAAVTYERNFVTDNQIGEVGAHRLSNVFLLDLHVQKLFRIGPSVTISPVLDCFNAANSRTVLQRDGFVGSYDATQDVPFSFAKDTFNTPVELLSSRVFRGGVQIAF
jgi:hypothetical protein